LARLLRLEFAGALYHVTARGNERHTIFLGDGTTDRVRFLEVLGDVCKRFNWICHAYCLMSNHYHLLIETPEANLSRGMRQLNGVYTQYVNRAHERIGHLFQGRFKGILVEKESYLLELARYIVLNPVRAGMVRAPGEWPWSSYLATAEEEVSPPFLTTDWLLRAFADSRGRAVAGGVPPLRFRGHERPQSLARPEEPGLSGLGGFRRTHAEDDRSGTTAQGGTAAPASSGCQAAGLLCGTLQRA